MQELEEGEFKTTVALDKSSTARDILMDKNYKRANKMLIKERSDYYKAKQSYVESRIAKKKEKSFKRYAKRTHKMMERQEERRKRARGEVFTKEDKFKQVAENRLKKDQSLLDTINKVTQQATVGKNVQV